MKKTSWILLVLIWAVSLSAALADSETAIVLSEDGAAVTGAGAFADGKNVTIRQGGTYVLSGSAEGAQVTVSAGDREDVTLVLNGVAITNPDGPAIFIENADETVLLLKAGTDNTLISGKKTDVLAGQADEDATGGAVFAKDDLEIAGEGTLFVGGYLKNGIHCSNDLVISGGSITAEAVGHAVKGKGSVTVSGGNLSLTSAADAIQTSEPEKEGKGFVLIRGGTILIRTNGDGIQAAADLTVESGTLILQTGDGAGTDAVSSATEKNSGFHGRENWYDFDNRDSGASHKGLKAGGLLQVLGGVIRADSADDGLHADRVTVSGGEITVSSGDDGVHADTVLRISDGNVTILKSYEGLEGNQILISGGTVRVTASDDGINANGGTEGFGGRGFGGFGRGGNRSAGTAESSGDTPLLAISGGSISVSAAGDGLDSNGNLDISGGEILVDGPSDSMNAPLDPGSESGGRMTVSGGTILAVGARGMAEGFSEASAQPSFLYAFPSALQAGQTVTVRDETGKALITHTLIRPADCLIFSSPELAVGKTYTVAWDGQSAEITLTSVSTDSGGYGTQNPFGFPGQRGPGRNPGGGRRGR